MAPPVAPPRSPALSTYLNPQGGMYTGQGAPEAGRSLAEVWVIANGQFGADMLGPSQGLWNDSRARFDDFQLALLGAFNRWGRVRQAVSTGAGNQVPGAEQLAFTRTAFEVAKIVIPLTRPNATAHQNLMVQQIAYLADYVATHFENPEAHQGETEVERTLLAALDAEGMTPRVLIGLGNLVTARELTLGAPPGHLDKAEVRVVSEAIAVAEASAEMIADGLPTPVAEVAAEHSRA